MTFVTSIGTQRHSRGHAWQGRHAVCNSAHDQRAAERLQICKGHDDGDGKEADQQASCVPQENGGGIEVVNQETQTRAHETEAQDHTCAGHGSREFANIRKVGRQCVHNQQ